MTRRDLFQKTAGAVVAAAVPVPVAAAAPFVAEPDWVILDWEEFKFKPGRVIPIQDPATFGLYDVRYEGGDPYLMSERMKPIIR